MTVSGANMMGNSNFQLASQTYPYNTPAVVTAMKADGTGLQNPLAITSFSWGNPQPTFIASNTGDIENDTLLSFGGPSAGTLFGTAARSYALRIRNLVPNTSFVANLPFNALSPASVGITAYPVKISNLGTSTSGLADGWSKTQSLIAWIDDCSINRCPGAKRVMGMRKGSNSVERFIWQANAGELVALRGRKISFAGMFRQKVGSGPSVLTINDGVAPASSTALTGSAYVNAPTNNYEFKSNDGFVVGLNAPSLTITFDFAGSIGDIVYIGTPTTKYGSGMTPDDLGAPLQEVINPDDQSHWNPPSLTPFTGNWPTTALVPGSSLYGFQLDMFALSWGQCHWSVREINMKLEFTAASATEIIFTGNLNPDGLTKLVFGSQQTIQTNGLVMICAGPSMMPLRPSEVANGSLPGYFTLFGVFPGHPIISATFDMDKVMT